MYCAIKNAGRCSAVPVGECICVRDTYESRMARGQTCFNSKLMSKAENQLTRVEAVGGLDNKLKDVSVNNKLKSEGQWQLNDETTNMHTNCKTLSSRFTKPTCVNTRVIATPIIGMTTNFPTASEAIAPLGKGPPDRKLMQARELPRHIRLSGMHNQPTKVAVSKIKASGGCPSGAVDRKCGWKLDDGGMKSALRGSTRAVTNESTITTAQGWSSCFRKCRERERRSLSC